MAKIIFTASSFSTIPFLSFSWSHRSPYRKNYVWSYSKSCSQNVIF